MDMKFMKEYFEGVRADHLTELAAQHNEKYAYYENNFKDARRILVEDMGLTYLLEGRPTMSSEEKRIWNLFCNLDDAAFSLVYALLEGAYMLGAEDRDRMLH